MPRLAAVSTTRKRTALATDAFPASEFDFMLSNPPYGKSWKGDLERMGGKSGIGDPRFIVEHEGDPEHSLITRSSDGQMMFLANMLSKMKQDTALGSRIAEVHNGSSLFTGDAGQGESNIRRWIIENDWLEAIVALPLNMFYNTGIATYIWVLSNGKPEHRRGNVQLIDATQWSKPLRKNLGNKNCRTRMSRGSAIPFSPLRRTSSLRSSPTRPSATGTSRSTGPCGSPSIFRRIIANVAEPPVAILRKSRFQTSSIAWQRRLAMGLTVTSTSSCTSLQSTPLSAALN